MPAISDEEKLRRHRVVESVLGTNAMEGLFLDPPTLALMAQFEEGEIEMEQLSAGIDLHVSGMAGSRQSASIPAERTAVDAA